MTGKMHQGLAQKALKDELAGDAQRFSFFQAVRLIEASARDGAPVGFQGPASNEVLRFTGNPSQAFPTADIEAIEVPERDGRERYDLMVNFLGLYGADSPIPAFYTEEVVADDADDQAVKGFLDLFQHRIVSLFYRCWTKYRYYQEYRPGGNDRVSQWLYALMGVLHPSLRANAELRWPRLLAYTGVIAMRTRSARILRDVLIHYFDGLPFEIEERVLRWARIEPGERARLGAANSSLGVDLCVGERIPDRTGKFAVHIGPMDFATFQTFLPDGRRHRAVRDLVRYLLIDQLDFDLVLWLAHEEIPPLGMQQDGGCRLGWSTWLKRPDGDGRVVLRG